MKTTAATRAEEPESEQMRICSLLPSATEMLYALGLGDCLAGVTHECDFPREAASKPVLIRPRIEAGAAPAEIDRQVSALVARGESIYAVDSDLIAALSPDLIITQDLCQVCAASPDDLATALARLPKMPQVLSLTPHSLAEVWNDIRRLGEITRRREQAGALATKLERRVAEVGARAAAARLRPRVLCLEWLDPYYVAGHWVPEMVEAAGGQDVLGGAGQRSFAVTASEIAESAADVVVIMPCGYNLERAATESWAMKIPEALKCLPAARRKRIFAVDANSYFSRPGPRLADGVALLASILHPDLFPAALPPGSVREI